VAAVVALSLKVWICWSKCSTESCKLRWKYWDTKNC